MKQIHGRLPGNDNSQQQHPKPKQHKMHATINMQPFTCMLTTSLFVPK